MNQTKAAPNEKAQEILRVAQDLIQTRGYNGFSFRDVADAVGIKSASIHYHFPTKADLARATASAYCDAFSVALEGLRERSGHAPTLLRSYGDFFFSTLNDQGRVCLGGILASDAGTLPDEVRDETKRFFDAQHSWIADVLARGQQAGEITTAIDPATFAKTFLAGLEGAMIIARSIETPQDLRDTVEQLIALVSI